MRKTRMVVLVAAAGLLAGAVLLKDVRGQTTEPKVPTVTRIAVCDVVKVVQNYRKIADLNADLEKRRAKLNAEGEQRGKMIDQLQAELDQIAENSKEYEKRLDEFLTKRAELRAWKEAQDALLLKWHFLATRQMFEEVLSAVDQVAKDQGIQLVLFKETEKFQSINSPELVQEMIGRRKVLYSDPSLDITEAIMSRMNINYHPAGS